MMDAFGQPFHGIRFDIPDNAYYDTQDGRVLSFTCLQAGRYWPGLCEAVGRPLVIGLL